MPASVVRVVAVALVALSALVAGCARGGADDEGVALDGSPRLADDEGVLTAVSDESITLDGERTYRVADTALAFSTNTRQVESLQNRRNQYVQIGLDERTMVWMSGVAAIVPGDPPTVYYVGHLDRVDGERLVFHDGTVFRAAPGLDLPLKKGRVLVTIDAAAHRVIEVVPR